MFSTSRRMTAPNIISKSFQAAGENSVFASSAAECTLLVHEQRNTEKRCLQPGMERLVINKGNAVLAVYLNGSSTFQQAQRVFAEEFMTPALQHMQAVAFAKRQCFQFVFICN